MKSRAFINRIRFYFSCWSKKGYSIFAGLGHEIIISPLAIHMYGMVMLKAASHGLIVNTDAASKMAAGRWVRLEERCCFCRNEGEVCPAFIYRS